jgi:hypothetical protein
MNVHVTLEFQSCAIHVPSVGVILTSSSEIRSGLMNFYYFSLAFLGQNVMSCTCLAVKYIF